MPRAMGRLCFPAMADTTVDAHRRCASTRFPVGELLPKFTSKDVARLAGVSQSTVSYVMSGKRPISEQTRQKVLAAIEGLTYEPNGGAGGLPAKRTGVVGLVIPFPAGVDAVGQLPFIHTIAISARARD